MQVICQSWIVTSSQILYTKNSYNCWQHIIGQFINCNLELKYRLLFNVTNAKAGTQFSHIFVTTSTSELLCRCKLMDSIINLNGMIMCISVAQMSPDYKNLAYEGNGNADGPYVELGFRPAV